MRSSRYSSRLFTTFSADLETYWKEIAHDADHYVFQSYEYLHHWYNTVGACFRKVDPCVVVVSEGEKAVAVFPFAIRRVLGARILEFLGGDQTDYNSPLMSPAVEQESLGGELWASVLAVLPSHDIRHLEKIPGELNGGGNPALALWPCVPTFNAYATTLPALWNDFFQRIPSRVKSDSRRQMRKLVQEHGTPIVMLESNPTEHNQIIEAMISQKRTRYKQTGIRDTLSSAAVRRFYKELHIYLKEPAHVHVAALRMGAEFIATHWGVGYKDRFYWLMPSYDSGSWAKYSSGRLLQEKVIEWAIERGYKVFDFTIGDEEYKKIWSNQTFNVYTHYALVSPRGIAFHIFNIVWKWLKSNKQARSTITLCMAQLRRIRDLLSL